MIGVDGAVLHHQVGATEVNGGTSVVSRIGVIRDAVSDDTILQCQATFRLDRPTSRAGGEGIEVGSAIHHFQARKHHFGSRLDRENPRVVCRIPVSGPVARENEALAQGRGIDGEIFDDDNLARLESDGLSGKNYLLDNKLFRLDSHRIRLRPHCPDLSSRGFSSTIGFPDPGDLVSLFGSVAPAFHFPGPLHKLPDYHPKRTKFPSLNHFRSDTAPTSGDSVLTKGERLSTESFGKQPDC